LTAGGDDPQRAWQEWNAWFDDQTARHATYEQTMLGCRRP
jgi:hypothetical protein